MDSPTPAGAETQPPATGADDGAPRGGFAAWLDHRTGYRHLLKEALDEPIPGGARWRYVFGSALTAAFATQLFTGLLLMTSYSPSATTAWGSVYFISREMSLGWLLRGVHHFGSQAMVVLLAMHLIQVLLAGAYRAPREVNWWFGMILLFLTLGLSLTGYLLPWDQKGYWATKVATNIAGGTPLIGPYLQKVVVGGTDYGNQTLTRFYALHVGVLPLLLIGALAVHVALFRRHGITHPRETRGVVETFWPKQVFYDTVASAVVLGVLVGLTMWEGGANLDAPADPASSDYPARPEWYFLSLFQMLKLFPGRLEVVGTMVVPSAIVLLLLLMPLLDKAMPTKLAHFLACAVVFALAGGVIYLTVLAVQEDARNPKFRRDRRLADEARQRALFLAGPDGPGIAPEGAGYLLRRDPYYHGRRVLESRCLSCHAFDGRGQEAYADIVVAPARRKATGGGKRLGDEPQVAADVLAAELPEFRPEGVTSGVREDGPYYHYRGRDTAGDVMHVRVAADASEIEVVTISEQSASDLKGFGSREWVRGLLEEPSASAYFGATPLKGMKAWKKDSKLTAEELDRVADFVAGLANVEEGETFEAWFGRAYDGALAKHPGAETFVAECGQCHVVGEPGAITEGGLMDAPNLFAYGSRDWLERMVHEPGAEDLYGYLGEEQRMPAFRDRLSPNDLDTMIRYIRGEYPMPAGQVPTKPEVRPGGAGESAGEAG